MESNNRRFKKIGVKNFRLFKDKVEFDLKPLTIFTGPNNSGKSTLNKLLVFLSQCFSLEYHSFMDNPRIKDLEYISLFEGHREIGDFKDNFNKSSGSETLNFYFTFDDAINNSEIKLELAYTLESKKVRVGLKNKQQAILTEIKIKINNEPVVHLSNENMYRHYKNEKLFKRVAKERYSDYGPSFSYTETELITYPYPIKDSNKYIWISKLDPLKPSFSNTLREYLLKRLEQEKELLIPSYFAKDILVDEKFFDKTHTASYYKKKLISKKITNREKFKEAYIDFENKLIAVVYNHKFNNLSEKVRFKEFEKRPDNEEIIEHLQFLIQKRPRLNPHDIKEFKDVYKYSVVWSKSFTEILYGPVEENASEIIYSLIQKIDSPLTELFLNEIETNTEDFNKTNFHKIYELIFKDLIGGFLDNFNKIFGKTIVGHTKIFKQNNSILPYYIFDATKNESDHLLEFGKMIIENKGYRYRIEFVNNWLKKFKIADELIVNPAESNGNIIGFNYKLKKGPNITPLADEGFGIKKLLNILIFLENEHSVNLIIEEPEANLHPSFQSKLADLFVDQIYIQRFRHRNSIIIETHSEYLVRKLQYLTALKEIKKEDLIINYVNANENVNEKEKKIREIKINEDGGLTDTFGPGFFDEATRTQFELLKLNKGQNN